MTTTANLPPGVTVEVIVDSGVVPVRQGYGLTRTYAVTRRGATIPSLKVQVSVDRNSYDNQSSYTAKVWTETAGWQTVTHVEPQSPDATAMPSYVAFQSDPRRLSDSGCKARHESAVNAAEAMAARLLGDALLILL